MSKDQDNTSGKLAFITTEDDQKNHIEWTAYKSKLIAAARAKKVNRALMFNKKQDSEDKADVESLAKAWAMLITPIASAELVATLAGRFVDEDAEQYDPSGAYKYLCERFGNQSKDLTKIEDAYSNYNARVTKGFGRLPTEKDMDAACTELRNLRLVLAGSHREVPEKTAALDLVAMLKTCHAEVRRTANDKIKDLGGKREEVIPVEMAITSAVLQEVPIVQSDVSDTELTALRAAVKEQQATIAELQAKSATSTRPWRPNAPARDRPQKCPTCNIPHPGLCEQDEANLDKIDWDTVPASRRYKNKAIALEKKLKLEAKTVTVDPYADPFATSGPKVCKAEYPNPDAITGTRTVMVGIDSKCLGGCFFNSPAAFPFGTEPCNTTVGLAAGPGVKVSGVGTAALVHTDVDGKIFTEYYKDSYLVESFDQPLLSVGTLMSRGFKIDFAKMQMTTRSGYIVPIDAKFDTPAKYLNGPEVKSVAEPMPSEKGGRFADDVVLSPTDAISRGASEPKPRTVNISDSDLGTIELHMRRLGVPHPRRMRMMADAVEGAPDALRKTPDGFLHDAKLRANMRFFGRLRSEKSKAAAPGAWVAYDLWSAPCPGVLTGAKYMIMFIDVGSGFLRVYTLKRKAQVPDAIKRFLSDTRKHFDTKMFFADNAKEHTSAAVRDICDENKIEHRYACEYEPWQNAHAEHVFDTLVSVSRTMLALAEMPDTFWEAAVLQAEFVHNISPDDKGVTPLAKLGRTASMRGLKTFGCLAYVRRPNAKRTSNVAERAVRAVHLGRARYKPGWVFWTPDLGHFFSSQAIFNESVFPFKRNGGNMYASLDPTDAAAPRPDPQFDHEALDAFDAGGVGDDTGDDIGDALFEDNATEVTEDRHAPNIIEDIEDTNTDEAEAENEEVEALRRSARDRQAPVNFWDAQAQLRAHVSAAIAYIEHGQLKASAAKTDDSAPQRESDFDALSEEEAKGWRAADDDEVHKVRYDRKTFGEGVPIDSVRRAIPLTFSRKYKKKGTPREEKKARLCVQGFRLIEGVDYTDSYSPTIEWEAIRLLFAIGTSRRMRRHSCDFKNAFCQTKMPEDQTFHVRMPPRYREYDSDGKELVYPLLMSLYGTVQAALLWYENVSQWLINWGFERSDTNACVFVHKTGNIILSLYVDDVGIWENDAKLYKQFEADMKKEYDVEFEEEMREYLGANIEGDENVAYIHVADYIDLMGKTYAKPIADADADPQYKCDPRVPAAKDLLKLVEDAVYSESAVCLGTEDHTLYRGIVGMLNHAAYKARPDIAAAVGLLSRAQAKPTRVLLHAALHVVKYLQSTRRLALKFSNEPRHSSVNGLFPRDKYDNKSAVPRAASDSDWGVRHSTSGYLTFIFGNLVGYLSKKQISIALSSTEAEIFAASLAGLGILYQLHLLTDMKMRGDGPATLLVDNTGAQSILSNRTNSGHARHIERRHLYLRELRERKVVDLKFVPTEKNLADLLTKPLDAPRFEMLRASLMFEAP